MSRSTSFDLVRPCGGCPFSRGPNAVVGLHPERIREIVASPGGFVCHRSIETRPSRPQECAGYLIFHLVNASAPQMMWICARLGMVDENSLLAHAGEVVTDLDELLARHGRARYARED